MIYIQLILCYLKIGFFSFGGGYAMLSLIYHEVVIRHAWISGSELADIVAISQMTPGPIAINSATYIGYTVAGFGGALAATIAVCTPAMTLMIIVTRSFLSLRGNPYVERIIVTMRPVVVGMIGAAGLTLIFPADDSGRSFIDVWSWILFAVAFAAAASKKVSLILIIVLSAIAGVAIYYFDLPSLVASWLNI
ncbi:MAG: chromate transporter [Rikenellaceae bacterium]